jgi:hypothetical protein
VTAWSPEKICESGRRNGFTGKSRRGIEQITAR